VNWIKECITNLRFSLTLARYFQGETGLRQWDPISPCQEYYIRVIYFLNLQGYLLITYNFFFFKIEASVFILIIIIIQYSSLYAYVLSLLPHSSALHNIFNNIFNMISKPPFLWPPINVFDVSLHSLRRSLFFFCFFFFFFFSTLYAAKHSAAENLLHAFTATSYGKIYTKFKLVRHKFIDLWKIRCQQRSHNLSPKDRQDGPT
jgi:hypothetical protein